MAIFFVCCRSLPSNETFYFGDSQHVLEDPVHRKYAENEANFRALDEASEADHRKQWAEMGYVPPPGTYFKHGRSLCTACLIALVEGEEDMLCSWPSMVELLKLRYF